MYEKMTFEAIMNQLLSKVPANMDKREGSVIYDAVAPVAAEAASIYIQLEWILHETYADTASLFYLKKRAAERGILQEMATGAVLKAETTPTSLEIPIGTRFSCDKLNYVIVEKIEPGQYKVRCEDAGQEGNTNFGLLIPIDYISGLETARLTELLIPGEDDEDVEHLRKRYFDSLNSQAFGGNIADYRQKVMQIQGVGGVKVYPAWNGGGTVKLTIISSEFSAPSPELVEQVQTMMDPTQNQGEGMGLAPIGHVVTVFGVSLQTINITTEIAYQPGWNWETAQAYITDAIDRYFVDMSVEWENDKQLVIRISQLESRILDCEAVLDISNTKLNGTAGNLVLTDDQIPVRGTVNGK